MINTERVPFRLIDMPCCGHLFCNVNHRWPTFCPNCGTYVFATIKGCASLYDANAKLIYDDGTKNNKETKE